LLRCNYSQSGNAQACHYSGFGGSDTAVFAFKVSAENGLFLGQMARVKLVSLEAPLRPVEQLDRRPPWKVEGRTIQEHRASAPVVEKSRLLRGNRVPFIMDV
jgi:hypothetical protein